MNRFDDMVNELRKDVEIPESVWQKYTSTFANLKDQQSQNSTHAFSKKRVWPAIAAFFVISTVSISAAAHMRWSQGLEQKLHPTPKQRLQLEENQMASFVGKSVTQGDVTVTVHQSIVDNNFAYLSFKVEGYQLEDGKEPGFSDISIVVDHENEASGGWSASFYDGLIQGADGKMMHSDGTPLAEGESGSYIMEDGSMEFQVMMMSSRKGAFIDRPIHVELKDLGVYKEKAGEVAVDAQGTWTFDWVLSGNEAVEQHQLNACLQGSDAIVQSVELSPVSISITYEFPRNLETVPGIDENGVEMEHGLLQEPPAFTGVRLKDGTMHIGISNGLANSKYVDQESEIYESKVALARVIDVDQVESLLFIKSYPEGEEPLQEENLYIVPIN